MTHIYGLELALMPRCSLLYMQDVLIALNPSPEDEEALKVIEVETCPNDMNHRDLEYISILEQASSISSRHSYLEQNTSLIVQNCPAKVRDGGERLGELR